MESKAEPSHLYHRRTIQVLLLAAAFITAALACPTAPALSFPEGYSLDAARIGRSLPEPWEVGTGDYTASVRRDAPDSLSAHLLAIAEATYPPRDLLLGMAYRKGYELGADTSGVPLWWCRGVGPSRVPYAITSRSVEYYVRLTELYRDRDFHTAGTRPLFESALLYRGAIGHRDTFVVEGKGYSDVYVAHLKLHWSWDDGVFNALTEGERVVVLTAAGDVLGVWGDGQAEEKIAISGARQIGRSKELVR